MVTYNVLNPRLCTPEWFPECHPDALVESARLELVKARLQEFMMGRNIICLQEVNREWGDQFMPLFDAQNYGCIFAEHGSPYQNFMGIMLAWPRERLVLLEECTSRLVDLPWSRQLASSLQSALTKTLPEGTWWKQIYDSIWYYFRRGMQRVVRATTTTFVSAPQLAKPTSQELAFTSYHRIIWARFQFIANNVTPYQFCVTNYHMPCKFKDNEFMQLHVRMLCLAATRLSKGTPVILCGDLNLTPQSPAFRLLKQSLQNFTHPTRTMTCWSKNTQNGELKDQLDYILYNEQDWECVSNRGFDYEGMQGPLPTVQEPSDHLPVLIGLRLCQGVVLS